MLISQYLIVKAFGRNRLAQVEVVHGRLRLSRGPRVVT
jgi:hypothetical protein